MFGIPLHIILTFTIIVPVLVGTMYLNKLPAHGRWIVAFMFLGLMTETAAIIYAYQFGNNLVIYNIYSAVSALVLFGLFYQTIQIKAAIMYSIVPLMAFVEVGIYGPEHFNSFTFTALNLITIVLALIAYYRMTSLEVDDSMFYFIGMLLFYSMSSTLFFFTFRYMQQSSSPLIGPFFQLHSYLNAFTNLSFAFSIWTLQRSYSSAR